MKKSKNEGQSQKPESFPDRASTNERQGKPFLFDWHDIVYFLELVRQGQLAGAARQLKVDQTTVGRRIRELEKSLNCKLFDRTKAGFVLTETGRHLLENAEVMEYQANVIAEVVGVEAPDSGGSVRVATMEGIGSLYLGPRMHRFYETNPSVLVELVTTSRWISLSKREADVFISFPKPSDRRLSTKKMGGFSVGLYAAPAYLEKSGVPRSKSDLDDHCFVDYVEDLVEIEAVGWLSEIYSPRNVSFRSTSLIAQYTSASNGLGIAMLPTFVAAHNPDLVNVLPDVSVTRDIWLSVHEDLLHIPRINAVVKFLEKQVTADRKFLLG